MRRACLLLALLVLAMINYVPLVEASPTYEDFTTYEEEDPNSHINVTAHHIDHLAYSDEAAYVYKDRGVDHFGDFIHLIDVKSGFEEEESESFMWMLSNDIDDAHGLLVALKTSIGVNFKQVWGDNTVCLHESYGGNRYYTTSFNGEVDTWYYLAIQKSGTSLTLKIYSDSERTNLLTTLSLTLQADHKFRYIFPCNTVNTDQAIFMNNDIANLDLDEIRTVTFYNTTGGIFRVNNVTMTNGTSKNFTIGDVLEFSALPQNSSYVFSFFNWTGGNSTLNPYNFTVTGNMTVWLIFDKQYPAAGYLLFILMGLVLLPVLVFVAAVVKKK